MKTVLIYLLGFMTLYFAGRADAADYYWVANNQSDLPANRYDSAVSACEAAWKRQTNTSGLTYEGISMSSATAAICRYKNVSTGNVSQFASVRRYGTSCPEKTEYNSSTGRCDTKEEPQDPCSGKAGQSTPFSKSGTGPDGYMSIFDASGGKKSAPAQTGCFNGCAASTAQQKCTVKVAGSYFCRGTAYYTGAACGTSTSPTLDTSDTSSFPDAQTISDKKPCVYTTGADGAQTCTSETSTEKEGQNCGTFNGQTICADKVPNSEKMKIDTNVSETSNPDGSKVVTKQDLSTKTVCTAVQTCTTTTVTTTTKITKDKDGNTTSSTTTTNTTTGTGGKNDGKGTGAEGEGGGEGTEEGGELATPELEEGDDYADSNKKYFDRINASPLAQAVTGIQFPEGGSCSFPSVTVAYLGTIGFNDFCAQATDWLAPLRVVMLAVYGFISLRHLMSA